MQQLPLVTSLINDAFHLAKTKFNTEHRAWIDLSFRLAGRIALAPLSMNLQRAGELDLVLRALEDEVKMNGQAATPLFAFHYQMMFSETWILACYEALRAVRQREDEAMDQYRMKAPNSQFDGISTLRKFKDIFADLELLRMPIAKYEIAKDKTMHTPLAMRTVPTNDSETADRVYDRKDPERSHIMPTGLSTNGSVTWQVLDHRAPSEYWVERRELSDRLLTFRGEVEPAGLREARIAAGKNQQA